MLPTSGLPIALSQSEANKIQNVLIRASADEEARRSDMSMDEVS